MITLLLRWFANALALLATVKLVNGLAVDSLETVVLAALSLGLLNAFARPLLILLTLPLTVVSFGLFTLVINAALFYAISRLVPGFTVSGASAAFWGALVFGLFSFLFGLLFVPRQPGGPQVRMRRRGAEVIDVEGRPEKKVDRERLG